MKILKEWAEELGSLFGIYGTHNLRDGPAFLSLVQDKLGLKFGHRVAHLTTLQLGLDCHNHASLFTHFLRELG